jgi:hypothetical protein
LEDRRVAEIQFFFATHNKFSGKDFKEFGRGGAAPARELIRK